jgi:uncharacterized protein YyaL (SSP411 family)
MHEHTAPANRLADELSPYLRLHAHNPVDWYPWGQPAMRRAREEDRPIFLSIGYSTCYWCHVMERESFSDPGVAAFMNAHFVNIKVDCEERPDLDEIYMAATQAYTGQGGWPNTLFLTPELKPYFAGTYFPPEPAQGRPSFAQVLEAMAHAWSHRRQDVEEQAESVAAAVRHHLEDRGEPASAAPGREPSGRSLQALRQAFDPEWGGFGGPPKFPTPGNLLLLLAAAEEGDAEMTQMLEVTLDRMARGGVFDQLAGGFHRYATDRQWRIPHFEKMLYDNGLLLEVYGRFHEITADEQSAHVCHRIVAFVDSELKAPTGGYWSALDAETDGREGAYYVWTREQLLDVLGEEDFGFAAPLYGFAGEPFFDGAGYVLHIPEPLGRLAARRRTTVEALLQELEPVRNRLLEVRSDRPRPATDEKILTDWNGILVRGLAVAGRALGEAAMIDRAAAAAQFLLESMRADDRLHHVRLGDSLAVPALLPDYVFLIGGLLALSRATSDERWLEAALHLRSEQARRLGDDSGGFCTSAAGEDLLARSREILDGALPSGNGQAALNDLELYELTGERRWLEAARTTVCAFAEPIEAHPEGARLLALAARQLESLEGADSLGAGPSTARHSAAAVEEAMTEEARSKVRAELSLGRIGAGGWHAFRLRLEIDSRWHVYAPSAVSEAVRPIDLQPASGTELRGVTWPPAEPAGEGAPAVYRGAIEIGGELRWDDEATPGLRLTFQPCDEVRCLLPAELVVRP